MARLLALILFGLAIAAAVQDFTLAADKGYAFQFRPIGQYWFEIDSYSLQLLQPALERHGAEWLWDPVMLRILVQPAAPVLFGASVVLVILGRRRRPRKVRVTRPTAPSARSSAAPSATTPTQRAAPRGRIPHTGGPVRRQR